MDNLVVDYHINRNNLVLVKNYGNLKVNTHVNSIFSMLNDWYFDYFGNLIDYLDICEVFDDRLLFPQNFFYHRYFHFLLNILDNSFMNGDLPKDIYLKHHFVSSIEIDRHLYYSVNFSDHFNSVLNGHYFLDEFGMRLNLVLDIVAHFFFDMIDVILDYSCCWHHFRHLLL